jgi:transposase
MRGVPAFMYVNRSAHGIGNGCSGICAMSLRGMISVTIQQRMISQEVFLNALVNEVLPQMNVLILDIAVTHNHEEFVECCRLVGVKAVFLPPYSYDFNPIEFAYHQFKQYIRDKWQMHL